MSEAENINHAPDEALIPKEEVNGDIPEIFPDEPEADALATEPPEDLVEQFLMDTAGGPNGGEKDAWSSKDKSFLPAGDSSVDDAFDQDK